MPRYVLHFFLSGKDFEKGEVAEMAGAETFTEAMAKVLRNASDYERAMIIKLKGASVENVELIDLTRVRDEMKAFCMTWLDD